jgi:hypothetical protein
MAFQQFPKNQKAGKVLKIVLFSAPVALCAYAGLSNGEKTLGWIEFTKKNCFRWGLCGHCE